MSGHRSHPSALRLLGGALTVTAIAAMASCRSASPPAPAPSGFEIIVVGSGAGGGPLAARLARAGKRVLLLEAGQDVAAMPKYQVPAMHALSTEDPAMAWWYFVTHHADPAVNAADSKITPQGVLYPRGSALGGSTAVNAMVTVLPSRADWDRLAALTGDRSFRAEAMDRYYERVREWLSVELADPSLASGDRKVAGYLGAAAQTWGGPLGGDAGSPDFLGAAANLGTVFAHDLNDALRGGEAEGLYRLPLATANGARNGSRENVLATVAAGFPLTVQTGALVTKVLWETRGGVPTAIGVEYVEADHVYGASLAPGKAPDTRLQAFASAEIVLSAGAFNSPQLLMLSGVGDEAALRDKGIDVVVPRAGVGRNLQDRYEAPVVTEFAAPLDLVAGCALGGDPSADPCYTDWQRGEGVYKTPGFLASILTRSSAAQPVADLQIFAAPTDARGYYPGYSKDSAAAKRRFTWLLLKAHTKNTDGTVRLVDKSPFTRPQIDFNYFDENDPLSDPDLLALVSGVKLVRRIEDQMRANVPDDQVKEVWPGDVVSADRDLAAWIRKETWGHHACCTDKMGQAGDASAVVDARFRVLGARGLRVVDASVFPEIPGTFIALPTYMLAEKAADVMLEDLR
jgi:choline dehydrogenase